MVSLTSIGITTAAADNRSSSPSPSSPGCRRTTTTTVLLTNGSSFAQPALLDTGTTLVVLPAAAAEAVAGAIPGTSYNATEGLYRADCGLLDGRVPGTVDFGFADNYTVRVPLDAFVVREVLGVTGETLGACYLGVAPDDTIPFSILGDTFLRSVVGEHGCTSLRTPASSCLLWYRCNFESWLMSQLSMLSWPS